MKPIVFLVIIVLLGPAAVWSADAPPVPFFVQLIRGSDDDAPPAPQAHLVGSELGSRLHRVFRWKNYWEINRQNVLLSTGKTVRSKISSDREIEISMLDNSEMTVCVYVDGKLVRKRHQALQTRFYITGGDNDGAQSWFIVVRRDSPTAAHTAQNRNMF